MSFLGRLGGALKGGVTGFIGSGFNPLGAAAGAGIGFLGSGGGKKVNSTANAYDAATTQEGQNAATDRNSFLGALGGGQQALDTSTRAAVSSAMPQFDSTLQGLRESAIRRGAANGDLETSNEGDLASAFERNIANSTASQALGVQGQQIQGYGALQSQDKNNYLDLLSGKLDRQQQEANRKQSFWNGIIGAAGSAAGAYFGSRGTNPTSSGGGAYGAF